MELPEELNVTEQMVDISGLTDQQIIYYQGLAQKLKEKYQALGEGRQIFSLSGPPGSGKSVVSAILNHIYSANTSFLFLNVGLDAFHFKQTDLVAKNLLAVKGRHDTYNTDQLQTKMSAFKASKPVSFPYYSREDHNPVADQLQVREPNVLMMLEGQWLLHNTPAWAKLRKLCSFNLYVTGSADQLRTNVVRRHVAGGRSNEDASNFYAESDLSNTKQVEKNHVEPDYQVLFYKDI